MAERWRAFGWDAEECDGHDGQALVEAMTRHVGTRPRLVVARTTFGKGVSFMEGRIEWHYLPMTAEQYSQALAEIQ
jgi:transketolase